jgi:Collagenase and related proteases
MRNSPEVLSPAGSWASLKAAAAAGADAVYFGAGSFNARRNADNFSDEDIGGVVSYCHGRGVKAYFALNTVIYEKEIEKAMALVALVCAAGADAIILQDAGLCALIRTAAPAMRLHASTQMSVHNGFGVRQLAKMGLSRVVLARELSLAEIAEIAKETPIELEVFVHGALCMSVSGQCYMSGFFGGQRSGNRGLCAQPCRLPFSCVEKEGVLSLKDLSALDHVNRLSELGVASLKIEGRMKRPEYVAAATAACRKAASGEAVDAREIEELRAVFSRGGFTAGYLDGRPGREMFGVRSREDVVSAAPVLKRLRSVYDNAERQSVQTDFDFSLNSGGAFLSVRDREGRQAAVTGGPPQKAVTRAADEKTVAEKLSKTGGTPFSAGSVCVSLEPGLTLPVAEINRMRREALALLLNERNKARPVPFRIDGMLSTDGEKIVENMPQKENRTQAVRLRFLTAAQIPDGVDPRLYAFIFLPLSEIARGKAEALLARGARVGAELPRAVFSGSAAVSAQLARAKAFGVTDALCGNLGAIACAQRAGFTVHGDFGLNCTNSAAAVEYAAQDVRSLVLSFENSAANLRALTRSETIPFGVIAYGRLPLMLVRNCPVRSFKGCAKDGGCFITDRLGERFPLVCDKHLAGNAGGASEILNPKPLWMGDRKPEILPPGVDFAQLYFTTEDAGRVSGILDAWSKGAPFDGDYTRGLYAKPLD